MEKATKGGLERGTYIHTLRRDRGCRETIRKRIWPFVLCRVDTTYIHYARYRFRHYGHYRRAGACVISRLCKRVTTSHKQG